MMETQTEQMYMDQFIAEVISIVAPSKIHFDIRDKRLKLPPNESVRLAFQGTNAEGDDFYCVEYGRSIGEVARKVRERLRVRFGK